MRKIVLVAVTALLAGCQGADPPREAVDKAPAPPAPQSRVAAGGGGSDNRPERPRQSLLLSGTSRAPRSR